MHIYITIVKISNFIEIPSKWLMIIKHMPNICFLFNKELHLLVIRFLCLIRVLKYELNENNTI